jgi:cyclophilin family peptidyl-prolyl cis-trans isomerase
VIVPVGYPVTPTRLFGLLDSRPVSKANKRERQRLNREQRRQYEESLAKRRRTMKTVRNFAILAVPVIALGVILNVTGGGDDKSAAVAAGCLDVAKTPKPKTTSFPTAPPMTIDTTKTYQAVVQTNCGSFTIQLDAATAPQTVNSFVYLAGQKFYDGTIFHRVAKNFVIQGGDPQGTGAGGPGYTLPDEPPAGGYQNGSVAMANAGTGTTGSQFFIVTSAKGAAALGGPPYLYSSLGQVTDGIETVRKINSLGSTSQNIPKQKPKAIIEIEKVTVAAIDPTTTTLTPPSS